MITKEKINQNEQYRIFYSTEQERYLLACTIAGAERYERYFSLTKEEYDYFVTKPKIFSRIVNACLVLGTVSPRYLCSQKEKENHNLEQSFLAAGLKEENVSNL